MTDIDKHIARVEAMLEELTEHSDHIVNHAYLLITLHDWWALAECDAAKQKHVSDAVAARCLDILCPPFAVHVEGSDVFFLVHWNLERSVDNIARAVAEEVARHLPGALKWTEEYSCMGVSPDSLDDLSAAMNVGGQTLHEAIEALLGDAFDEDEFEEEDK